QNRIVNFLDALRAVEPDQYFYQPTALHVTVLSLFTASEQHERFSAAAGDCKAAIEAALADAPAFAIEFRGITTSPGAILIQGFPAGATLKNIRARLRSELLDRGLSKGVDSRYRVITAHITVMRFRKRPSDSQRLMTTLESYRQESFGVSQIRELSLVQNDWYLTPETVTTLSRYPLP
ncbi:MAG: 2'-5' RNA ligase family protein, partial [Akkermansiaceae bacterium]|nr:2'-5' RNA ligase family protein [Verrucomicrobiales bacterium]